MRITGLINEQKTRDYFKNAYGVTPAEAATDEDPGSSFPVFTDGREYFAGGFKWFYSFMPDADPAGFAALVKNAKLRHANVVFNVSLPFDPGTRMINYILDLKGIVDPEKRLDLYEGKTRNLVRKSHKNAFTLTVGAPPEDFYALYSASMSRLKSAPRGREWLDGLTRSFGDSVVTISLYDGGKLIGCNYAICSPDYALLMFNISDSAYWGQAVNDRLYDELVTWAIGRGIRYLDFGPSLAGDDSHNHFKAGFGAKRCYIFNARRGSPGYRFKAFMSGKIRSLKLRLASLWAHRQMIFRYLVSGGTATVVDIGLLYAFTRYAGLWYLASAVLAFIIAFGISFFLQKFWTFRDRSIDEMHRQASLYLGISLFNLGVNTLLVYLFTDFCHLWYIFSQVIAAGLVALSSFFLYKYWVFRPERPHA